MKTGFIYGYPNKPVKKRYSYHGLDRDCLIQPDPGPFDDYDIGPPYGPTQYIQVSGLFNWGWYKVGPNYTIVHNSVWGQGTWSRVGQENFGGLNPYRIYRFGVGWNTSFLPDNALIVEANVQMLLVEDHSISDFSIVIRNGMPSYPHVTLNLRDYYINAYSGNGGELSTSGLLLGPIYIWITELSWINKYGNTKFALHSSKDIASSVPSGREYVVLGRAAASARLNIWYQMPL